MINVQELIHFGIGSAVIAKEKLDNFVQEAIKEGKLSKQEGEEFLDEIKASAEKKEHELEKKIDKEIKAHLKSLGVATKEDINALKKEIEALKKQLQPH